MPHQIKKIHLTDSVNLLNLLNLEPNMTHVILTRHEDEKHTSFPTPSTFQEFLKAVREFEPDRRWEILEFWETA